MILWGLSFKSHGSFCPVQVDCFAPCGVACFWMLMPLMRHCPLRTLCTSSIYLRVNMVRDPVLVCVSGLWVHMLWVWSLLLYSCRLPYGVLVRFLRFGLGCHICAFTLDVGVRPSFYALDVLVCAIVPQPWMMRLIASSCENTLQFVIVSCCTTCDCAVFSKVC